ncbi:AAA family ATPase [Cuniculiplasma divulgatum]|uniref:Nucleotide kinase n=1 Tax=Cuniculiplasma divulgatum TaxID=1673428 RepID=A0A1N5SXU1_9ARCH|nr:adenylate kinase family protein [Cuniculiplasma divulgatum]EQB69112.1 MAG: hypothetical protein AMDU5_GPLC00004G0082 [Thermoplasmatales archaeon Gpl]MCL4319695.1 adenylate kinase family protein [Candidatus Thermoplasmatota archaeon]MCL6015165.1 adenylate kinase family protein [Candidatus Thermoplasmatota archaeon]SIM40675.1 nucleotide kinase [Cuniculiplasma divulgatum]SJK84244.1 nucleotide kinase [Cuniculiplasma divulgatum]
MNFNISVTGVPGTGKSTLCNLLASSGYEVIDLNKFSIKVGCTQNDEVDLDCLIQWIRSDMGKILDSHYSHLLPSFAVILMECSPEVLEKRLMERGYNRKKITENMDCLMSDCIGYECTENYPRNRILRLNTDDNKESKNLVDAVNFIRKMEMKHNGT